MPAKKQVWDLTEEECKDLKDLHSRQTGRLILLQDLERVSAKDNEDTSIWWKEVRGRLRIIGANDLLADHEAGKIWRK